MLKQKWSQNKKGFTIIEVSLFLAISGLLIAGVVAGTVGTINNQRYNDTVQGVVDFLNNLYSSAAKVQNNKTGTGNGDSECYKESSQECGHSEIAVYGEMAVFGKDKDAAENKSVVYTYHLSGKAEVPSNAKDKSLMEILNAIEIKRDDEITDSFNPVWQGEIQNTNTSEIYQGVVAIVRSPMDGVLYTFRYDGEEAVKAIGSSGFNRGYFTNPDNYKMDDTDLCIQGDNGRTGSNRRDIRIAGNGHNSSAISLISIDELNDKGERLNRCQ